VSFRSGTVALVGRPNVGKSTLLNQLVGQKIAATTHKPQTTRKNLLGVIHTADAELMLLDTPGYHRAEGPLNRFMVRQAEHAITEADVIGYLVEARADGEITPGNQALLERLATSEKPVVVIVNKIDRIPDKTKLLAQIQKLSSSLGAVVAEVVPISALKKNGLDRLVKAISGHLPEGEAVFQEGQLTDKSERQIVAEMVREKIILETQDELPYAVHVDVSDFEDERPRLVRIRAEIWVERPSQKAIVIGRGGERLKAIGTRARKDIEFLLGSKVFLELIAKVEEGWSNKHKVLERFGYAGDGQLPGPDLADANEEIRAHLAALEDVGALEAIEDPRTPFPREEAERLAEEQDEVEEQDEEEEQDEAEEQDEEEEAARPASRTPTRHARGPRPPRAPAPVPVAPTPKEAQPKEAKPKRRAHGNKGRVDALGRPREGQGRGERRWAPRSGAKPGPRSADGDRGGGPRGGGPRGGGPRGGRPGPRSGRSGGRSGGPRRGGRG